MRKKVYIETSVVSYLAGRPTADLQITVDQQWTHRWWEGRRQRYDLVTSEFVHEEAACGNRELAAKRLEYLQGIQVLSILQEVHDTAKAIVSSGALPPKALVDAYHVAICATHGVDALLTWNCKHLANRFLFGKIDDLLEQLGYVCPLMVTPWELLEMEGK